MQTHYVCVTLINDNCTLVVWQSEQCIDYRRFTSTCSANDTNLKEIFRKQLVGEKCRRKKIWIQISQTFSIGRISKSNSFSTKSEVGSGKYRNESLSKMMWPCCGQSGGGFRSPVASNSSSGSTVSYSTTRSTAVIVFSNSALCYQHLNWKSLEFLNVCEIFNLHCTCLMPHWTMPVIAKACVIARPTFPPSPPNIKKLAVTTAM